jgi:hypothetical protein
MQICTLYSHLNGHEHILVHKPRLWEECLEVIADVDSERLKTKVSEEKRKQGNLLYSPRDLNRTFAEGFNARGWHESRTSYWITADAHLIRKTLQLKPDEQRAAIVEAGETPLYSYNQTDFVKDRIAVEVQFGKYAFVAYDLFVKHMAFYVGDVIDVGIEILPMKSMQVQMSSGIASFEGELYNILRHGRGTPAVPLVLVGVTP